ncbi:MAG: indoleacetamide hydrolase [Alphaproteobacteria bacterium]|jgi:mandelamide amidase|nr:indoleacetamide hydrolase [Alphaproteobacteria bacterium]
MAALHDLDIGQAAAAIRSGAVTAEALAEALIGRIAAATSLNAFAAIDADRLRQAARDADRRRAGGEATGPLHGVPLAIKDNIDVAGYATTGGTPALAGHRPARNAPIVERLVDGGALILGKTGLHELAFGVTSNNGWSGAVRNPYDPTRSPGGSSGGTAAAVAARLAPGGIGTDTGGSTRIPAAFCGIAGFRPSLGRWPQAGIVPISHTRDTPGPMTRGVADCLLLDNVVTGAADGAAPPRLAGLRLGLPRRHFWEGLDGEVAALLEARLDDLRAAGVDLVEAELADVAALDAAAGFPIALYEVVGDLRAYLAGHGLALTARDLADTAGSPDVRAILQGVTGDARIPEAVYREALGRHRPALQQSYASYFGDNGVDAMILPTVPLAAPRIGEDETVEIGGLALPLFPTLTRNTSPASVAGLPGLSLPAGMTAAGLPIGIEIDGPAQHDRPLLRIGLALETVLPALPAPAI